MTRKDLKRFVISGISMTNVHQNLTIYQAWCSQFSAVTLIKKTPKAI